MSHSINEQQSSAAVVFPSLRRLHVPRANAGLRLVMQSGVETNCLTGIPFSALLKDEFKLPPADLAKIDVLLLDGKPVDNPDSTPVRSGSRIALAAGLPGIAGLAMKSGSAVRGLRPGITHRSGDDEQAECVPGPGIVEVALFSLALPLLAPHFLKRGVVVPKAAVISLVRPAIAEEWEWDGRMLDCPALLRELEAIPEETSIALTAVISGEQA